MKKTFLKNIELLIFDLDGVIYTGSKPINSAIESIKRYYKLGKKIAFFTNNSTLTRQAYVKKLSTMNIDCNDTQIYTSSIIAGKLLSKKYKNGSAFVVGEEGLIETLESFGINILNTKYEYQEIISNRNISSDFVIAGLDRTLTYKKLAAGSQLINRNAKFFATNDDPTLPHDSGFLPGAGVIVNALSVATGKSPFKIFGKPSPVGINQILKDFNVAPESAVIIGDRPDTDILCGKKAGIKTALVLTGIINNNNLPSVKNELFPDVVINNLSEF